MKRKLLLVLLLAEAAALLLPAVLCKQLPEAFPALLSFPFAQIAAGLRELSLAGAFGNGAALLLLILISFAPAFYALCRLRRERALENALLFVLSLTLLSALYFMINPARILRLLPLVSVETAAAVTAMLGVSVWATLLCCVILRLVRMFRGGDGMQLLRYARNLLYVLLALFTGAISFVCVRELIVALTAAQNSADRWLSIIRFLVAALPYALDLLVTFRALNLLDALSAEDRGKAAAAADRLSKACCTALVLVSLSGVLLNDIQLLWIGCFSSVQTTANFPLISLAFVLSALLLARLVRENKRLAEDNALFI